jgi:DNA-binding MarR family transcriptional regulator
MSSSSTKLVQIFEASAALQTFVTVDMMLMFSAIARANERRKGIHMKEIETLLSISSPNCSRILQSIGMRHDKQRRPGLDLVVTEPDPDDVRARLVFVTPKGRKFWSQLKILLGEVDDNPKTPR